jgi:N-formylglutamate amidohydrolase
MNIFDVHEGESALILSVPHSGIFVPDDIKQSFTAVGQSVPDTDWFVDRLYDFAGDMGTTTINANYSRYVADMNRPPDNAPLYPGQAKISLCPDQTFDGQDIYKIKGEPDDAEIARRLEKYWRPYHNEIQKQIARVKAKHGYAVLYDAHSIKQSVPRLFDGKLPDLSLGTADGESCSKAIEQAALSVAEKSTYSCVLNGRFIGGFITRNYGDPDNNVHAFQMEIAQTAYMDEESCTYDDAKADQLKPVLQDLVNAITDNASARV